LDATPAAAKKEGMMMKSEFMKWFVAQHGGRDDGDAWALKNKTDQELRDMIALGRKADQTLAHRELWDDKKTSALYAWQAAEKTR
jgi:hypothetical protein